MDVSRAEINSLKATLKLVSWFAGAALLAALVVVPSFWAFRQITAAAEARKQT
jgi:hypothetical protein